MRQDLPFLKHILDEVNFLLKETKGLTFGKFINNDLLKRGVTRSLEIIGEATKNISSKLKNRHKDIEWKLMAGMRDKIIHYYFGVNWVVVWDVVHQKIPELKIKVEKVIKEIEKK